MKRLALTLVMAVTATAAVATLAVAVARSGEPQPVEFVIAPWTSIGEAEPVSLSFEIAEPQPIEFAIATLELARPEPLSFQIAEPVISKELVAVIETQPGCAPCALAKRWFEARNIRVVNVDPTGESVPVIHFRGQRIEGFDVPLLEALMAPIVPAPTLIKPANLETLDIQRGGDCPCGPACACDPCLCEATTVEPPGKGALIQERRQTNSRPRGAFRRLFRRKH